jgi:hypothetical protein
VQKQRTTVCPEGTGRNLHYALQQSIEGQGIGDAVRDFEQSGHFAQDISDTGNEFLAIGTAVGLEELDNLRLLSTVPQHLAHKTKTGIHLCPTFSYGDAEG